MGSLSEERVLARCPDAKAVIESRKTADASKWSGLGRKGAQLWGVCLGSSSYQVAADAERLELHCDCPSRKRPCKHAIALLLLFVRGGLPEGSPPAWAEALSPRGR